MGPSRDTGLSVRSVLESSNLLNALSSEEIEMLAGRSRLMRCARGETIWLSGAEVDFFGCVGRGFVKMVRTNANGVDATLEIMGPGQIFGLLGVIEGTGCPIMASGLTDVAYVRIPKQSFFPIYERSSQLKDRLVRRTAVRMHQKLDFMAKLSNGRVEERIAAMLFILAESYSREVGDAIEITIPLTRQDIGEMAGTTTETTIRTLSRWSKDGIVTTDHHRIIILKPTALEAVLKL